MRSRTLRLRTKLQRAGFLLQEIDRPPLIDRRLTAGCRLDPTNGKSKEEAAAHLVSWLSTLPSSDIAAFSDGSQTGKWDIGYGYVLQQGGQYVGMGKARIDPCSAVFDTEAVGAWRALERAVAHRERTGQGRIWICVDNTAVIWCLRADASISFHWAFQAFHQVADAHDVEIKWCPGHCDVQGNETADELAKDGSKGDLDPEAGPTAAGIKSEAKKILDDIERQHWRELEATLSDL